MGLDIYGYLVKKVRSSKEEPLKTISEYKKIADEQAKDAYYSESDVYFRKVNFVYKYFSNKLDGECCIAEKSDIEELVSRCDKVLADHSLAQELLPTQSGFFFGSTDYDEWYFGDVEDCKQQMEKLLSMYDEDTDVVFFIMSW